MKYLATGGLIALSVLASRGALAQDVVRVAPASNKILVENEFVRVVESTVAPGAREALHTHPAGWYYVIDGGTLDVRFADGKQETWSPTAGDSSWGEAEGPHTSVNVGKTTVRWVLVEVKSAAKTH